MDSAGLKLIVILPVLVGFIALVVLVSRRNRRERDEDNRRR